MAIRILCIAGPTASGKSSRAVREALTRNGEIISVDSRQIYKSLDIGTEKISHEERQGVPHYLIDIIDPCQTYSAAQFAADAKQRITEIAGRGKMPILVGGSHFYYDALLRPLPAHKESSATDAQYEKLSTEALSAKLRELWPQEAKKIDLRNRRRMLRALSLLTSHGQIPERSMSADYATEWIVLDPERDELRAAIDTRLSMAVSRGLITEVDAVRTLVGDIRLNELGLEYRVIGEHLRGERSYDSILPALSAQLWQYARRQKAWLRKLRGEGVITAIS